MVSSRKARPSLDGLPIVISAPTLKEAYRKVKVQLGDDAVILGSRSVNRRQNLGLGNEKTIEVIVQPPGSSTLSSPGQRRPASSFLSSATVTDHLPAEIGQEVERIEGLVQAISDQFEEHTRQAGFFAGNPVAESMLHSGTKAPTIAKLMTRFTSETGKQPADRAAATTWLTDNLRASNCEWEGFHGCHAFLGRPGCGRTALIYRAAAKIQKLGRKTLVLSIMPANPAEVRRLQSTASESGFDAAVIQVESQLAKSEAHLARYDAVLVDLPAFGHPVMKLGGALHDWLSASPSFHRHLVLPLESDPDELADLAQAAKDWHGDWVAVSRCDLTARAGKFLDFSDLIPLPFSLVGECTDGEVNVEIACSGKILDRVLGNPAPDQNLDQLDGTA